MHLRGLVGWLAVVLALTASEATSFGQEEAAAEPHRFALLVGVNKYDQPGFTTLEYAERDVDSLAAPLKKQGFKIRMLKGSGEAGNRATRQNILDAFDEILRERAKNDVVLFAFVGDGLQTPLLNELGAPAFLPNGQQAEDARFCPVDAVKDEPKSMVSLAALLERLGATGGTNLLLVDARRIDPSRIQLFVANEVTSSLPDNTAIFVSCAVGQESLESKRAGGGHGVFFHHVLEGLNGKAADEGVVTWDSLTSYVRKNVNAKALEWFPDRAKTTPGKKLQTPHTLGNLVNVVELATFDAPADSENAKSGRRTSRDRKPRENVMKPADPTPLNTVWRGNFHTAAPNAARMKFADPTKFARATFTTTSRNEQSITFLSKLDNGAVWEFDCKFVSATDFALVDTRRLQAAAGVRGPVDTVANISGGGTCDGKALYMKFYWPERNQIGEYMLFLDK